jgi:hypothetical protein
MNKHRPAPQLIEMFHRWQCQVCKHWTNYNEGNGEWWCERGDD